MGPRRRLSARLSGWIAAVLLLAGAMSAQRPALPEFVHGDECLFCHRNDIGPQWQKNAHTRTVRAQGESTEAFLLGDGVHTRELKKIGYGRFAIREPDGSWNETKFGGRCAGCHTTALNAGTGAFTHIAIDCYACHGVVDLEHTNDTSLVILSKKRRGEKRLIASICGSCHLRGGASQAKGFPYAYHFVPGDDLFADYRVSWSRLDEHPHIVRCFRQMLEGDSDTTCLTCHQVHAQSTIRHRRVLTNGSCADCHNPAGPKKHVLPYTPKSAVCEY